MLRPVALRRCAESLAAIEIAELASIYGKDGVRVWGVTPGESFRNRKKWERMQSGDAVLFCGRGHVFAYAFVQHKVHSRSLAEDLWGQDEQGRTWEYAYFLTPPMTLGTPYARLAAAAGYSSEFVVQGFMLLNETQSERVWRELGLGDD